MDLDIDQHELNGAEWFSVEALYNAWCTVKRGLVRADGSFDGPVPLTVELDLPVGGGTGTIKYGTFELLCLERFVEGGCKAVLSQQGDKHRPCLFF
jgi:hypothetical protein